MATLQIKVFFHGLDLSDHAAVQYYLQHQLQRGWIWGRQIDLSDTQWRDFRGSLGPLSMAMTGFVAISYMVRFNSKSQICLYNTFSCLYYTFQARKMSVSDQIRMFANIILSMGFIGAL